MLLEKKYSKEYIDKIFLQFDAISKSNPIFADEVTESGKILFKQIKDSYNLDEDELKQIIKFGIIAWSQEEVKKYRNLNFCDRCGYCCKETSPILIRSIESDKYLDDPFFIDNIMPYGLNYHFIQDSPCEYYNESEKKCNIYDKRPINCQEYPIKSSAFYISPNCNNSLKITVQKIEELIRECERL